MAFASDLLERANIDPEIHELYNQSVYNENCQGTTICVIAFLPNIYESNAAERNEYLQTLLQVAKTQRRQPFTFFWL